MFDSVRIGHFYYSNKAADELNQGVRGLKIKEVLGDEGID
jgi:hypothetical protein